MGYRVSPDGLQLIEAARKRRGWDGQSAAWCEKASVSLSTLKRFRAKESISEDSFKDICKAVGIEDWQSLVEVIRTTKGSQKAWGNAPSLNTAFYGRTEELQTLTRWIVTDKCRLLSVRGLTGIGKTALIRHLAENLKDQFDFVIWHSLYPSPFTLRDLLNYLGACLLNETTQNFSINDLIDCFRNYSCLVILDDIQTILEAKQLAGQYQNQFKDYQSFFEQMSQPHQSCIITVGHEQPTTLSVLEERSDWVRSLSLSGLAPKDSLQLIKSLGLTNLEGYEILVKNYCGNPSFMIHISRHINNLFGGNASEYLDLQTNLIGGIAEWLDNQFNVISPLEEEVLYWLAILRHPISFQGLLNAMRWDESNEGIFGCLESLMKRSLIERAKGFDPKCLYSLAPVLLKYVSMRLVDELSAEIVSLASAQKLQETFVLRSHALFQTSENDDINKAHDRYILIPLKNKLIGYNVSSDLLNSLNLLLNSSQTCGNKNNEYTAENINGLMELLRSATQ